MTVEKISVCLPKGDAMKPLAESLERLSFPVEEYHSKNRTYRPEVRGLPVRAKIMAEKDVAIQIGAGNYDIGFCGTDWIQEHATRYRTTRLFVFKPLGLDKKQLYVCTGLNGSLKSPDDLKKMREFVTIVSEYPNLAENFAIRKRLRKFKVFSAWGSVEGYPPEHADVVILAAYKQENLAKMELHTIGCELESELSLVVNRKSFEEKDLSPVLNFFSDRENSNDRNS